MSTYYGLRCRSHKPPIDSEPWYNHGAYLLTPALALNRHALREYVNTHYRDMPPELRFLSQHVSCDVVVVNEYGDES